MKRIKVAILSLALSLGLFGVYNFNANADTVNYVLNVKNPSVGMVIDGGTTTKNIDMIRDGTAPFNGQVTFTITNTGTVNAVLSAQLGTAPAGITYVTTVPSTSGELRVETNNWMGAQSYLHSDNPSVLTTLGPAHLMNMDTIFSFGPATPVGTYTVPIDWTVVAE